MPEGPVVVVTGASAGVGRAVALAFAGMGARVALLARGVQRLQSTREEIERLGGRAMIVPTDVASSHEVESAADQVEQQLGPIEIWVNNAVATIFSPVLETSPEEFLRATQVTYLGTVYGTQAALRRMRPRNRGVIIQVGSALAYRAIPLQASYCAAKHAVRAFTDSLRSELVHDGCAIQLTMVHLPALNTPQFTWCRSRLPRHPKPVGRIFQPEVAAEAILWASRHRRREVYVGWPTVLAIHAQKFISRFLDWYLTKRAYEGQLLDKPLPEGGRKGNLFEPVVGTFGAHGRFDGQAHARSVHLWINLHQTMILAIMLGATAAVLVLLALLGRL
jgi:NAD(P)-dependent dehydrogenase (short-subunit alcohol dehydrogenase family)